MAKDHYLQAGITARFSETPAASLRNSVVCIHRVINGETKYQTAASIGYRNNYYNLTRWNRSKTIDGTWGYEGELLSVLEKLKNTSPKHGEPITAHEWLRILVPFITASSVRPPNFEERYDNDVTNKLTELFKDIDQDYKKNNTNLARIHIMAFLLGAVSSSDWRVLHAPVGSQLINNESGYTISVDQNTKKSAIFIPIDSMTGIQLTRLSNVHNQNLFVRYGDNQWYSYTEHQYMTDSGVRFLNQQTALYAKEFIYGSTESLVKTYTSYINNNKTLLSLECILGFTMEQLEPHFYDWHRLVTYIEKNPIVNSDSDIAIDWAIVRSGWHLDTMPLRIGGTSPHILLAKPSKPNFTIINSVILKSVIQ